MSTFVGFLGIFIFLIVGVALYALWLFLNPQRTAADRLADLNQTEERPELDIVVDNPGAKGPLEAILTRLAAPQSEEERKAVRAMLLQGGYKARNALEVFNGLRITAAICLPLLMSPVIGAMGSLPLLAGGALGAAALGYMLPYIILRNTVDKRQKDLLNSFPDCLDLLVSCVEAGLGLDAAIRRVAVEMETSAPELSREFNLVTNEISAGVPRVEALRHLEQRTGLNEIRSLVNMLAQAERFGTSVANSLRVHARVTRGKRMAKAEEAAAKVSPKLTVVMILFFLPVLMSFLLGPAAIRVMMLFTGG